MSPEFVDFNTRNKDAKKASKRIEEFLRSCVKVIDVKNVENHKDYQLLDIDLLCIVEIGRQERSISIEIKGDTKAHYTGNFFFETISNESLGTQGCFLKSKADLLFYYLIEIDYLYIFPMEIIREWFLKMHKNPAFDTIFHTKKTHTIDSNGNYQHTTIGRCVNIEYTLRSLIEQNIQFREIESMINCRCMVDDLCFEANTDHGVI
ncbi:hypothetical protein FJZ33_09920 [Candidatus Poribacteria bacterium]|nr:hypothetical protein [Candidatus Poribacteria bacterium]